MLDLNDVAKGYDYADLGVCDPSPDGRYLAWSLDTDGNEVYTLWIRDLGTGEDRPVAERSYFTSAWSADSRTLFYTVPDAANRPHQVRRHTIGARDDLVGDELVLEEPDASFELQVHGTRSGELLVLLSGSRDCTELSWLPADDPTRAPQVIWPRRPQRRVLRRPPPGGERASGELAIW